MFGHRTPVKQRPTEEPPRGTQGKKAILSPIVQSSLNTSVRRSIGEWETGRQDAPSKALTAPKASKTAELPNPKLKATTSQAEPRAVAQTTPTEGEGSPQKQQNLKYTDRLVEAKACVLKAKTNLGNSRNIKSEIKAEVTQAINRLYQLVKEAESVKRQVKKTDETEKEGERDPEKDKETEREQRKDEKELIRKIDEHTKLMQENNEKMERLKVTIEKQQEMQEKMTYARVAAVQPVRSEQTALHSVVVTAVDENETGEEVLDRIRKVVNARESGIAVEKIRKAKDRKVIVGCKTHEERQRVKERLEGDKQLTVEEMKNKDPLVILKDVLKYNTDKDVLDALRNQNKGVLKDNSDQKMEIAFKKPTRNPLTHHIVMRVSPVIWQRLVDARSVLIDLQRVRVADQSPLVQCSLCLGYGHGRRFCKETVEKCCHCGGPHMKSECADWLADVPPSCTNCMHSKLSRTDHNAFSSECPIRRRWEALARATVAYC